MADNYFLCIIGAMERLWFHQIVLFSEATASVAPNPKPVESLLPISESLPILSLPSLPDEEISRHDQSPSPGKQISSESISVSLQGDSNKERPTRTSLSGNRTRSHSSSPSTQNQRRKFRKAVAMRRLQKSMSCKTLGELELEEVKGFMDLGFIFKKEFISPRMMSVVPGLQRLGTDATKTGRDIDIEGQEEKKDVMRPYLSEAWLIKRPDSPLLNLKIPKLCSSADMKKLLRFWARSVASEMHQ